MPKLSAAARRQVRARSNNVCALCHTVTSHDCHIDHIKPRWCGGSNDPFNLQVLCAACHAKKTADEHVMQQTAVLNHCIVCGETTGRCPGPRFKSLVYGPSDSHVFMTLNKATIPAGYCVHKDKIRCILCHHTWRLDRCVTNTANLLQHQRSRACLRARGLRRQSRSIAAIIAGLHT